MTNDHKVKQDFEVHTRLKRKFPVWRGALFAITALLVGGLSFMSCESDKTGIRERVTVGVSKSFLSIPVYIAEKKGFFSDEGLDVTIKAYPSGKKATQGLFAGEVDISTVADIPVVFNSFERQDFCIFATFAYSYSIVKIIARRDSGIKTGEDLKGKKVGANRGTTSHFFLGVFLIHNQVPLSEVKIVNTEIADLPSALKNGAVDAISVWEPHTKKARQLLGDNAIELASPEICRMNFNFAVMKRFAQEHPEILQKFLRSLEKSAAFIRNEREKSLEIMAAILNLDKDTMRTAWDDVIFGISLDQSLLVCWDEIARWGIKNKLTNKKGLPNYLNYIFPDALEGVKPESITIIR